MLDELKTLRLVSDTGSLQAAAQQRGLTQSAVTRQVQRLEDLLRVDLVDRNVRPVRLTRAGATVLARGREILAAVDELKDSIAPTGKPVGILRLGLAHGVSEPGVSKPIERFKRRLPDVWPSFHSSLSAPLLQRVRMGELDAAVILQDPRNETPGDLPAQIVGRENMAVVEALESCRRRRPDLRKARWVVNPEGCLFRSKLDHWAQASFGEPLRVAAEAHDTGLQMAFVASGLGLGLIPRRIVDCHPLASELNVIEVEGLSFAADVLVVRAPGLGNMNGAVDLLEEELRTLYGPTLRSDF